MHANTLWQILTRKAHTFLTDPLGALANQPRRLRHLLGKRRLREHGVLGVIEAFQDKRCREGECLGADYSDLWFLYTTILQRRPRLILEFGSGVSTVVMAQALLDSGGAGGRLLSLDASTVWAHSTLACLPTHLRRGVHILHTPIVEVERLGVKGFTHQSVPPVRPNFVYLDGPELTSERQVAFDLLDMEGSFPPDFFLVIDDRKAQTQFLRQHLTRRYHFRSRRYQGSNPTFELNQQ